MKVGGQNDAPVLDTAKVPVLNATYQDAGAPIGAVGSLVSSLVDFTLPAGQIDNVDDADNSDGDPLAVLGIAITAADAANGTWYFTTNGGAPWTAMTSPRARAVR